MWQRRSSSGGKERRLVSCSCPCSHLSPPPALASLAPMQAGQKAAKYAAILALFAIDPEERNRGYALRTLRDFVVQRRWAGWREAGWLATAMSPGGWMTVACVVEAVGESKCQLRSSHHGSSAAHAHHLPQARGQPGRGERGGWRGRRHPDPGDA